MFVERWRSIIVAGLFVLALHVHAGIAPARASASPAAPSGAGGPTEAALVGAFGVGDALEATVDLHTGAFTLELPVPGARLRWDSRLAGVDRFGFGPGWGLVDLPFVDVRGGARAFISDGRVVEVGDDGAGGDVVFRRSPGVLPARSDGTVGDRDYEYTLAEPGGRRTFFSPEGDALAAIGASGDRDDWLWADGHRLVERIDALGVVRRWTVVSRGRVRLTSHIGGVDASRPAPPAGATTFEFHAGQLAAVVGPTGARVGLGFTTDGLLERVEAASGALTSVEWQLRRDGAAAARRVRVRDAADGRELLARVWGEREADVGLDSTTTLVEGATRVVSQYVSGRLARRNLVVSSPFGERVVSELELAYRPVPAPEVASGVDRLLAAQPIASTVRFSDGGRSRSATTRYVHDRYGRITSQTEPDGTVGETDYDEVLAEGADVPTGHPLRQRRTAPDGLIVETRHTLDPRRMAPIVTETFAGRTGDDLRRTARTEFALRDDGSVAERREFPQGGEGVPTVTRISRDVDRAAGTITTTETVAAGTPSEASTSETVDLVNGVVTARVDEVGRNERVQLDGGARAVRRTDLAGRVTELSYLTARADGRNAVIESSASGVVGTVEYDALGRQIRRTDNLADGVPLAGHVRVAETREYPEPGAEVVTDAWGAETTTRRDALGRVVELARPGGVSELARYDDALGSVTTGRSATGDLDGAEATTTRRLDVRGEVVGETEWRLDGEPARSVERAVDGLGREVLVDDGIVAVSTAFDPFGNAVETARAGPAGSSPITARRTYDGFGASVEKTLVRDADSRSGGTRTFDVRGRLVAETDQSGGVTTFELAPDGLVLREATSYGRLTVNTYDPASRALIATVTTSPIGDPVHRAFDVDAHTGAVRSAYDPLDRAATEITWTHNAFGGVTSVQYPDGARIEHEYDEHGRRVATVDVAGAESRFDYDEAGRLARVVRRAADGRSVAGVTYRRDALGRLARIERDHGAVTEIDSTSLGQVAAERTAGPDGAELSARTYRYDARGSLIVRTDRVRSAGGEPVARRTTYRYDADDRLTSSVVREGEGEHGRLIRGAEYELTVSGDVSREVVVSDSESASARTTVREFEYAPTGELIAITQDGRRAEQRFDPAGNLVRDLRGATYRYDARNRPVATADAAGVTTRTRYWADDRRAAVAADADETRFYWDDDTLLNEAHTRDGESSVAGYLLGERRHARAVGDEVQHLVHDRHGSTAELLDASGAIVASYAYSDYGAAEIDGASSTAGSAEPRGGDDGRRNPFQWAGEYTDLNGTQHLAVRTYAPTEMRFTTRDTAALHNRYSFGDGNPVMNVDPTGRNSTPDWKQVMNEPWFKIMTTALSLVLTVVGFLGITPLPPQAANILKYVVGHYGGIAGAVVQAFGTAVLSVDAVDSLLESKFLTPEQSGIIQITGQVLSTAGQIVSGASKLLRKAGNDEFQLWLDNNDLRMADLELRVENMRKILRATNAPAPVAVPAVGDVPAVAVVADVPTVAAGLLVTAY